MRRIRLGELSVSKLALGGVNFNPDFPVAEVVSAYLELGGNLIDTAHCYGFWDRYGAGASERSIADFVRGNRAGIIVTTKGGHPSAPGYRTTPAYLSPERIRADIDDSLARLECDHIGLYWLHRDDEAVGVDEIVEAISLCRKAGWEYVTSHRSGETEAACTADFFVAIGAGRS